MVLPDGVRACSSSLSTFIVTLSTSLISSSPIVASTSEPLLMFTGLLMSLAAVGLMKVIWCNLITFKVAALLYTGSELTPFLVFVTPHLY